MAVPTVASTRSLGPTNYQSRIQTGTLVDGLVYAMTFRQEPAHLVVYDPDTERIVETHEIPFEQDVDSPGSWTLTALDDRWLYTVLRTPPALLRFDRRTGSFEHLETLPDSWCRAIGAADSSVYFSMIREPRLYEYEHDADELRDLGRVHPVERYTHDLHVGSEAVYVGGGASAAHLTAVDRSTGDHRDVLPPALAAENAVQSIVRAPDGRLVAGTSPGMRLAVFEESAPNGATVVRPDLEYTGGAITSLRVDDGTAHFTTTDPSYAIWACELDDPSGSLRRVAAPIDHPTRDIFAVDGDYLGVGSGGYSAVWRLDPTTGESGAVRLADVGLPKGPGNVQSLEAMGGDVYGGGSRVTGIHHVDDGNIDIIPTAGEPKVMRGVGGRLYQAVYGGAGIVRYTPGDEAIEELAWIGHEQNRPRAMHYLSPTGHLLVGTRPDYGCHGGAIAAYDVTADSLVSVDRHVIPNQAVNTLTSIGDTVYLGTEINGGGGTDPIADTAALAAWDPVERELRWSTTPFEGIQKIRGLTALDGRLYAQTSDERFFAADPADGSVMFERGFGPVDGYGEPIDRDRHFQEVVVGECRTHDGRVYGVNFDRLFCYDPASDSLEVLLSGLGGKESWHNFPQLAIGDDGALYVAESRDLLRVELDDPADVTG